MSLLKSWRDSIPSPEAIMGCPTRLILEGATAQAFKYPPNQPGKTGEVSQNIAL
jgi:hypothetical protein